MKLRQFAYITSALACFLPVVRARDISIDWDTANNVYAYATVGDKLIFEFSGQGLDVVKRLEHECHPDANETETERVLGTSSPVEYTLRFSDMPRRFFTTSISSRCDEGHYASVTVREPSYEPSIDDDECYTGTRIWFLCISCFSGSSLVETPNGVVRMDSLKIGDKVRTPKGSFSPIFSILHNDKDASAMFFKIFTDQVGADGEKKLPLEISGEHLVFLHGKKGAPIPASQIRVGDILVDKDGQPATVNKIKRVRRQGLYAPATVSGDIVVNNIAASCYVDFGGAIGPSTGSTHWLVHAFLTPRRILCTKFGFNWCQEESYVGGLASHVRLPVALAAWLAHQQGILNIVGRILVTVVLSAIYVFFELLSFFSFLLCILPLVAYCYYQTRATPGSKPKVKMV